MRPRRRASSQSAGRIQVVAGGRDVALVEDEVDDLEHRREPVRELRAARHLERHAGVRERALGPHDALGDGRLRHEKRPGDLVGREAAEQPQRQSDAGFLREDGMARREHQAQQVVADVIVDRRDELLLDGSAGVGGRSDLFVLALGEAPAAQHVDRPVLRGGHEPGARVLRHARLRPALERRDERVLGEVFRQADVAHHAREPGDQTGRLDPPDRVDRSVRILRRHSRRLEHGGDLRRRREA